MPKLAQMDHCTGCAACGSVCPKGAIAMTADADSFLNPVIDPKRCVECGLCEKVCPVVSPVAAPQRQPQAYAAYSVDEAMRLQSSSGGVFTELARQILGQGGAVYGAAYDARFAVRHICVLAEEDLAKLRGAKYAQSDLREIFPEVKVSLDAGQPVLFSGTPCQVAGLKAYLRKDYANLVTVDFVCHSVPSPVAWQEYVKYRAQQDSGGQLPSAINLRGKETGWSRYRYSNRFEYADGRAHSAGSGESLYMKLFVGGYISRSSCDNCQFKGYSRVSDVTLGDFWGIWDIAPEMDDNKGTSVVLVQSEKGVALMEAIRERLVLKKVSLEEASAQNPAMIRTAPVNPRRAEALQKIREGQIEACGAWFVPPKRSFSKRLRLLAGRVIRKMMK